MCAFICPGEFTGSLARARKLEIISLILTRANGFHAQVARARIISITCCHTTHSLAPACCFCPLNRPHRHITQRAVNCWWLRVLGSWIYSTHTTRRTRRQHSVYFQCCRPPVDHPVIHSIYDAVCFAGAGGPGHLIMRIVFTHSVVLVFFCLVCCMYLMCVVEGCAMRACKSTPMKLKVRQYERTLLCGS